jgi:hypothetical protein
MASFASACFELGAFKFVIAGLGLYDTQLIHCAPFEAPSANDLASVSRFYGPGFIISWLAIASYPHDHPGQIDPDLLITVAYPTVAAIDVWNRRFFKARATHDLSLDATAFVVSLSVTLSSFPCNSIWSGEDKELPPISTRALAWVFLYNVSTLAVYSTLGSSASDMPLFFMASITGGRLHEYNRFDHYWITGFLKNIFLGCFCATMAHLSQPRLPKTDARLTDLDQSFTLGVTTLYLIWSWRNSLANAASRAREWANSSATCEPSLSR